MKYPPCLKTILSLSTLAFASAPVGATILAGDITNYWRLDGDFTDSVGGSNGTYSSGSPTFTAGFDGTPGGAVDFSGVSDYVSTALTVPVGPKSMSLFLTAPSPVRKRRASGMPGVWGQPPSRSLPPLL